MLILQHLHSRKVADDRNQSLVKISAKQNVLLHSFFHFKTVIKYITGTNIMFEDLSFDKGLKMLSNYHRQYEGTLREFGNIVGRKADEARTNKDQGWPN